MLVFVNIAGSVGTVCLAELAENFEKIRTMLVIGARLKFLILLQNRVFDWYSFIVSLLHMTRIVLLIQRKFLEKYGLLTAFRHFNDNKNILNVLRNV